MVRDHPPTQRHRSSRWVPKNQNDFYLIRGRLYPWGALLAIKLTSGRFFHGHLAASAAKNAKVMVTVFVAVATTKLIRVFEVDIKRPGAGVNTRAVRPHHRINMLKLRAVTAVFSPCKNSMSICGKAGFRAEVIHTYCNTPTRYYAS